MDLFVFHTLQLYFSVTIIMVAIFGVVDENIDPLLTSESTEDPKSKNSIFFFKNFLID